MKTTRHPLRRGSFGLRRAVIGCLAVAAGLLGGCDDGPEADASSRYCGILDPEAAGAIVGDLDVTAFGGGNLDATRRQGNGISCSVTTGKGSEHLISISLRDTTGQADWDAMKAQFDDEIAGSTACKPRTQAPVGYVCQGIDGTDETTLAVLFDARWVRVIARTRDDRTPPDPEKVLRIAENIDQNLTAYDAGR